MAKYIQPMGWPFRHQLKPLDTALATICLFAVSGVGHSQAQTDNAVSTVKAECIQEASNFHRVNPDILQAIINVESAGRANLVNRNSNGSLDVGRGQTNSIHFKELQSKFGIYPEHLLDACVSDYVSAWMLSQRIAKFGNTWFGIAAYHSTTPDKNLRYQVLLYKQLLKMGVFSRAQGQRQPMRIDLAPR